MSRDLIGRKYEVRLFVEGDPNKRRFSQQDILKFIMTQRNTIVGELLGMFEVWKSTGMPKAKVEHRFQPWAELMGGVLEANGYKGFLASNDSAFSEDDSDLADFKRLAEACEVGRPYGAADFLGMALSKNIFKNIREKSPGTGQSVAFGKLLGRFLNESYSVIDEPDAVLVRGTDSNKNCWTYTFIKRSSGGLIEVSGGGLRAQTGFENGALSVAPGDTGII